MPNVVEPGWQGRRVSVRRVTERDAGGELRFGDVVGDLVGLDAQTAVIESRDGLVEVPRALIAAARLVPAATVDELALQRIMSLGLRAAETTERDGWLLRADHGLLRRANSVLPLKQLRAPLDEALDSARAWYAERNLPLQLGVPVEARRLLDAELGERGWNWAVPAHVMTARLDQLHSEASDDVELTDAPDDEWLALYRGGEANTEVGRALLTRHDRVTFAHVRRDGRTVAVARGAVDEGWLGVMAVEVAPSHRRQGLARAVTAALWQWGRLQDAARSYLQVEAENTAAVTLYGDLGYHVHHDYHYREDPGDPGDPASD